MMAQGDNEMEIEIFVNGMVISILENFSLIQVFDNLYFNGLNQRFWPHGKLPWYMLYINWNDPV